MKKTLHRNHPLSVLPSLLMVWLLSASISFAQADKPGVASGKEGATSTQVAKSDSSDNSGETNKVAATGQPVALSTGDSSNSQTSNVRAATTKPPAPKPETNPMTEGINERMPGWMKMHGEYRMRFEGKSRQGSRPGVNDGYFLQRLRIGMTIKPTEHWSMVVEGQDSHVFGLNTQPPPSSMDDNFDLREAYIDYTSGAKRGWAMRAGRMAFKYGDQRVVGVSNWSNTGRVFDAIRFSAFGEQYAVDVFASSVVSTQDQVFNKRLDGQNFYGMHSTFPKIVPKAELNFYAYWRTMPVVTGERVGTRAASRGDSDTFTYGVRLNGKLPAKFDYTLETMLQRGTFAADKVRGYAFHTRLGYSISESFWKPKLLLEYNQGSGDDNPNDGVRGTYDQLYPDNHGKYGIHDTIGLRNIQNLRVGMGFTPTKKAKLDFDYHNFWLTQIRDGLYNESGTLVSRSLTGTAGKHIASEADMQLIYNLKSYLQLGAVYSYYFAGSYLKSTTPGAPQTSTYTYVTYKF